ncbi:MAG: hypothetical protein M0Z42_20685 [Actinomycetota bacterium]|jgi:hypothetical protein|nr:hypothetical protein [Actinomycetota bacterium]
MPTPTAAQSRAAARITAELAELDFALPGSVTPSYVTCGSLGCRCVADPPVRHGPYFIWTRTVAGHTVSRYLSKDQYAAYAPWLEASRRARALFRELQAISAEIADAELRPSTRQARRPTSRPRKTPAS